MNISSGRIPRHPPPPPLTHTRARRRQRGDRMKVGASICKEEKHLTVLRYHGIWRRTRLHYKDRPFKTVQRNDCCLLRIWRNQQIIMFCWPCISTYLCNKNQPDALFILSLFRQSTSTFFGHICSPSSGGIAYICNSWYVLCFSVDCPLARPTDSQPKSTTRTHCCIYTLYVLMMGYICPKHVVVDWRNKLRINSASGWFLLHRTNHLNSMKCSPAESRVKMWRFSYVLWTDCVPIFRILLMAW